MKQTEGGLTVDLGHRGSASGGRGSSSSSRREPDPANDTLGVKVYGAGSWHLPGFGEAAPRCGEFYPEAVCETCGEPEFSTHMCGRRECPDCWSMWAKEAAVKRTVRLQARRLNEPDDYRRQVGHAVVSPEEEIRTVREYKEWRTEAGEIAKEKGFRGADVVPHAFRTTEEANRMYRQADPPEGKWAWLRNEHPDRLRLDAADPLVYWSPHYHIIGLTSPDMEQGDGGSYVYTFLRSLPALSGKYDRESHEAVFGLYRYLLSHVGLHEEEEMNALVGYGDMSNARFGEFRLSDREMDKLEEEVREAVAVPADGEEEGDVGAAADEVGECPQDGCEGVLIDVFDVGRYLLTADPPPEVREKMQLVRDWRLDATVEPPPGLKAPQTEADAREAWDALVGRR